jgi:hypothetical protein
LDVLVTGNADEVWLRIMVLSLVFADESMTDVKKKRILKNGSQFSHFASVANDDEIWFGGWPPARLNSFYGNGFNIEPFPQSRNQRLKDDIVPFIARDDKNFSFSQTFYFQLTRLPLDIKNNTLETI